MPEPASKLSRRLDNSAAALNLPRRLFTVT
jgi:hypothetical protein